MESCFLVFYTTIFETVSDDLKSHVFGQHIVTNVIVRSFRAHMRREQPSKALVMSFHGWTGSGKNYVSSFIANALYKMGAKSQFVHLFMSTLHFPDKTKTDVYKVNFQSTFTFEFNLVYFVIYLI